MLQDPTISLISVIRSPAVVPRAFSDAHREWKICGRAPGGVGGGQLGVLRLVRDERSMWSAEHRCMPSASLKTLADALFANVVSPSTMSALATTCLQRRESFLVSATLSSMSQEFLLLILPEKAEAAPSGPPGLLFLLFEQGSAQA